MKIKAKESKFITTKIINLYRNIAKCDKRNKKNYETDRKNEQNGNSKSLPVNNYFTCKWV